MRAKWVYSLHHKVFSCMGPHGLPRTIYFSMATGFYKFPASIVTTKWQDP